MTRVAGLVVALAAVAVAGCPVEEGVRAELVVRFEARETLEASETLEVTVYDASGAIDPCVEVLSGSTAILGTLPIVAGPVEAPVRQASVLSLDGVSFGSRLFFVAARLPDEREIARGCAVADVGPSSATVALTMHRVACSGAGSVPCGPDAVCRDGSSCEDRACRIGAGPVSLSDFTYDFGVGASQVLAVDDGILVAFTGAVGARGGVAIAHLSTELERLGPAVILDASPCTWPALAPADGGALVVWGDCEGPDFATIRAAGLFADGTLTGDEGSVPLEYSLRSDLPADQWNAPEFLRVVPTEQGALAVWEELASDEADPEAGPWQIRTVAIRGEDSSMPSPATLAVDGSAVIAETSTTRAQGLALQYVDIATRACHLAIFDGDGGRLGDDLLGGQLSSCVTVAFSPTEAGYTFLSLEIRRLVPWPDGEPTDPLLLAPDEPLARGTFGAFAPGDGRLFLGWEEHSDDALTSRLQIAILDTSGVPTGPAVPLLPLTGGGPYAGFSMAADQDTLYAAWQQGAPGSQSIGVARIDCAAVE